MTNELPPPQREGNTTLVRLWRIQVIGIFIAFESPEWLTEYSRGDFMADAPLARAVSILTEV